MASHYQEANSRRFFFFFFCSSPLRKLCADGTAAWWIVFLWLLQAIPWGGHTGGMTRRYANRFALCDTHVYIFMYIHEGLSVHVAARAVLRLFYAIVYIRICSSASGVVRGKVFMHIYTWYIYTRKKIHKCVSVRVLMRTSLWSFVPSSILVSKSFFSFFFFKTSWKFVRTNIILFKY